VDFAKRWPKYFSRTRNSARFYFTTSKPREKHFSTKKLMGKYLFIYLKTANDGRPRPEEGIGNAKVNKNRDARTHTHTHTHTQNITNRKHGRG